MASCPADHELLALLAREFPAEPLRGHVMNCSDCRSRLDRLQAEILAIRVIEPGASQQSQVLVTTGHQSPASDVSSSRDHPSREVADGLTPGFAEFASLSDSAEPVDAGFTEVRGIPTKIGKYLIVGRLSRSGQADVFRAVHPELHRDLVLKLAHRPVDGNGLSEIVADGQRLAALEHPHIVRVYDLDFFDGRPYLVMEYVRGRTLAQFARDERVTPRRAAAFASDLASAVAFAHRRGIVHQDIKPANVLIDEEGTLRLIDFGLAWQHDAWSITDSPSEGGTFAFMAPEQARIDRDRVRPLSDVFSIGAVLFFLLTGNGPFAAESMDESWNRALHGKLDRSAPRNAGVPRALERIALKAMAADPEERYRSAAQLEQALRRFLWWRRVKWISTASLFPMLLAGFVLAYHRAEVPSRATGPGFTFSAAVSALTVPRQTQQSPVLLNIEHMAKRGSDSFDLRGNLGERSF